ncbi:tetratricopeptide repeat protein [Sedimentibacter sp. B4]|uniref:tetratricopeptide repeat protein n=1 Tax=Sedimentibacter sp. B4 TaxID=304766 RepID=UPI0002D3CB6F|nr:tetratricopeptide repeat protein [Sedimentibacter sp. B4]
MPSILTDLNPIIPIINLFVAITSLCVAIIFFLIPLINSICIIRKEIDRSLSDGIKYHLNNKIEEARNEYNKALKYQNKKFCKRLIIDVKLNLYETYHHEKIDKEKNLDIARINEEALLKALPNYKDKKYLKLTKYKYKYQYAILCCNLGDIYNELALIRSAKNNYENSKKYSSKAIDVFRNIKKLDKNYFGTVGLTYSNLAITYRGLANLKKDISLLQISLNNAEKSLTIYEEIKDYFNIARIQNNIGNIYSDLVKYKEDINEREKNYINSENYLYKSLEFYKIENYPYESARSYQNLGSVNLHMMYYCDDKNKAYSYFIKAKENYEICKSVIIKDKYENEYINLYYNLMSLNFQALKKFGDIQLIPNVVDYGNFVLEICTIENNPKRYVDTNGIIASVCKIAIECCEFIDENEKIDMIEDAINRFEIVLRFKELSMQKKANTIIDLIRLNMTLLDMTKSKVYEVKCNSYCKELEDIIKVNPEVMIEIEDMFFNNVE